MRDVLETLHDDENSDRDRFSKAEIAMGAWRLDSRYNFLQPIRDKRLAATNGIRKLLHREAKPAVAPHWFVLPGVERALGDLGEGPTPLVIRETNHPETGQVMTEEQKQAYLNPPKIDGARQSKGSLNAERDVTYRLAHLTPVVEEPQLAAALGASQNGNGPSPEGVQVMAAESGHMKDPSGLRMM